MSEILTREDLRHLIAMGDDTQVLDWLVTHAEIQSREIQRIITLQSNSFQKLKMAKLEGNIDRQSAEIMASKLSSNLLDLIDAVNFPLGNGGIEHTGPEIQEEEKQEELPKSLVFEEEGENKKSIEPRIEELHETQEKLQDHQTEQENHTHPNGKIPIQETPQEIHPGNSDAPSSLKPGGMTSPENSHNRRKRTWFQSLGFDMFLFGLVMIAVWGIFLYVGNKTPGEKAGGVAEPNITPATPVVESPVFTLDSWMDYTWEAEYSPDDNQVVKVLFSLSKKDNRILGIGNVMDGGKISYSYIFHNLIFDNQFTQLKGNFQTEEKLLPRYEGVFEFDLGEDGDSFSGDLVVENGSMPTRWKAIKQKSIP